MKKHRHQVALTVAIMAGGLHTLWSALVLLGWAQPLVNFSAWAHMIKSPPVIAPFDLTAAITVIIIASCIGYAVGTIAFTVYHKASA